MGDFMKPLLTKLCVALAVFFAAYVAFGAWAITMPATSNPRTQVKSNEGLIAAGTSPILNGLMRVKAGQPGEVLEFDQDIMTEEDGGWSYEVAPADSYWDHLGSYLLQIYGGGEAKAGRYFDVIEP
jgi:hypothetical protein